MVEKFQQCGNGSMCAAYLLMKENNNNKVSLRTKIGILQAKLNNKNSVSIKYGSSQILNGIKYTLVKRNG